MLTDENARFLYTWYMKFSPNLDFYMFCISVSTNFPGFFSHLQNAYDSQRSLTKDQLQALALTNVDTK